MGLQKHKKKYFFIPLLLMLKIKIEKVIMTIITVIKLTTNIMELEKNNLSAGFIPIFTCFI